MSIRLGFGAWGLTRSHFYTGTGRYSYLLLRHLPSLEPSLSIVAYAAEGEDRPDWLAESVEWRPIPARVPRRVRALHAHLFSLPSMVRSDRLDLFHAPTVHVRPSLPPVPRLACPVVVTVHDLIPLTFYRSDLPARLRLFYRWNLRRALRSQALITVSNSARDDLLRLEGMPGEKIWVSHNPIDFESNFSPAAVKSLGVKLPYILYAGSYEPRKNLARTLRVYAALANEGEDCGLVAIVEAQSGYRAETLALLRELGIESRVTLLHSLPEPELRALYTQAELLFFPSLAEGFGFPPLQAAACGVPVVAADIPVLREVLGESAMFVDPLNEQSMIQGLRKALHDAGLRSRLMASGPRHAASFRVGDWVRRHLDAYQSVAGIGAPIRI